MHFAHTCDMTMPQPQPEVCLRTGLRIGVVNLEPVLSKVYRDFLTDLGHQVDTATTAAGLSPGTDVVFADLLAPGDLNLLRALRDKLPAVPIVIMASPGIGLSVEQALELNVHAILHKPFWLVEVELILLRLAQARPAEKREGSP